MREYVCGFLFTPERDRVLLIRKNRPAWQAGKLNGIGGKIEPGETPAQAMVREFREETSLHLGSSAFQHVITLSGPDDAGSGIGWRGHFFRAFAPIDQARALTDELLEIHPATAVPEDAIPNLRWMIPLMLDDEAVAGKYAILIRA
jgi:8-oxo-dGTP diphosphatase